MPAVVAAVVPPDVAEEDMQRGEGGAEEDEGQKEIPVVVGGDER